jgi:hypothetical protein
MLTPNLFPENNTGLRFNHLFQQVFLPDFFSGEGKKT